jgi:hypothetical protein
MARTTVRWILIIAAFLSLSGLRAFGQEPKAPTIDSAKKQDIVDEISTLLNKDYLFGDTAKKMEEKI